MKRDKSAQMIVHSLCVTGYIIDRCAKTIDFPPYSVLCAVYENDTNNENADGMDAFLSS